MNIKALTKPLWDALFYEDTEEIRKELEKLKQLDPSLKAEIVQFAQDRAVAYRKRIWQAAIGGVWEMIARELQNSK